MAEGERDSTQDWLLPAAARPATMFELEQRVDVALAVARASEAAALEIGAAALDAADQARRAAELAERASASAAERRSEPGSGNGGESRPGNGGESRPGNGGEPGDERLRLFTERADRVVARLLAIERLPQHHV
jgi:hypothetical protein